MAVKCSRTHETQHKNGNDQRSSQRKQFPNVHANDEMQHGEETTIRRTKEAREKNKLKCTECKTIELVVNSVTRTK